MNKVRHILTISAMPHDSKGATKLDNKDSQRAKQNSSILEPVYALLTYGNMPV